MKKLYTTGLFSACILVFSAQTSFADLIIDNTNDLIIDGVTIQNDSFNYVTKIGDWADSTWAPSTARIGDNYNTARHNDGKNDNASFTFNIGTALQYTGDTNEFGYYSVELLWPASPGSRSEKLSVTFSDGTTESSYSVNQVSEITELKSFYFGDFYLTAGSYITLWMDTNVEATEAIIADAVRLTSLPTPAPEPATMLLFGAGLCGLVARRKVGKK